MKKKTKIIIGISVVALIVIVCFFLLKGKHKKAEPTYQTAIIERGSITNTITATGTIEPISTVEVGTQVSGTIAKLYVDYNTQVKKGQLLAELDRTLLVSELNAQRTNLESAKNELDFQQKNFNRTKQLYEKHAISETEYEEAEYKYNSAKYAYQRAQSQVVSAQTNLNYATIYSPINGVILSRAVDEGQSFFAEGEPVPSLWLDGHDVKNGPFNACIKVFTVPRESNETQPTILTSNFPDAYVGETYNFTLSSTGTDTIEWRSGNIPSGLALSRSGVITGQPEETGEFNVKLTAFNNVGIADKTLTLNVKESAINSAINEDKSVLGSSGAGCEAGTGALNLIFAVALFINVRRKSK